MRLFILVLTALLMTVSAPAQPWLQNLPSGKSKQQLTLPDYQQAFESYWAPFHVDKGSYYVNGVKKKAAGWKQFKRWEYEMQSQVDPQTGAFPKRSAMDIKRTYEQAHPRSLMSTMASWTPLGPTSSFSGYSGIGRINCVAFHPDDVNTFWVGAAAGGLWQTTDNGATWTCLTDQNGVLAVSDIAITPDYATSHTLYIATGDRDAWDNRSIGVLKSTDGGQTWATTGITYSIYEGQMVNRLLMDPSNQNILIAATTRGVFKTLDGGATWDQQMTGREFIDMEFHPSNPNIIYGSTKNGEIYLCTDGQQFGPAVYSDGNASRIELAVSPNQPDWVYALASNGSSGLYGIFKSIDSGNSFAEVFSGSVKNLLTWESDGSGTGGQGWYDLSLASSPMDANIVLVGGVNSWRSVDGGLSWNIINHWYGDQVQAVHADKHKLAFRPNGDVFECNDGGVYLSADNGSNWQDKTNGIQISQMYRLGVSQLGPEDVITGLQDNGTKLHSGDDWFDVRGGDGMECLIDYTSDDIQYGTVYYGQIDRTTNHWLSSTNVTPPAEGAWVTPYVIDPNDPATLYGGYDELWKTTNRGDTWEQISTVDPPGKILSIAVAPSDSKYICFADYSQIWRTTDGATWTNITNNLPSSNANIEYITIHRDNPDIIWVALSGYSNPGVYQTTDGGNTWSNISQGLPPIPAYCVVQDKQHQGDDYLYLGTELGVYFKKGDENWVSYADGLPNVKIGEIEIYYAPNPGESRLRAATFGRGLWETPVEYASAPMAYVSTRALQNNTSSVSPGTARAEILKIEVNTTGNLNPLTISSLTFNTNGTTDAQHDIANARLFFGGSSNSFSTSQPYGSPVVSPDGIFTFEGSQILSDGKNVFWLTYDIPANATQDNVVDAQCLSVTIDQVVHPVIESDPAGYRTIGVVYCEAGASQSAYEYISKVSIGHLVQPSDKGDQGYEDYTAQIIDLVANTPQPIYVENGVPFLTDQVLVWIDWNKDGDFDDEGELEVETDPSEAKVFQGIITPPANAPLQKTRMRVRLHDAGNGPNDSPCGYATWGEVEDYTIRLVGPDTCGSLSYLDYKAQSIPGTYTDLGLDGQIIPTANFDDANSDPQDIGFSFVFKCDTFTRFILNTNGFIKLGDTPPSRANYYFDDPRSNTGGIFYSNSTADANILSPLNLNLDAGTGTPEYRYQVSGDAPYRVCTIQYKNVREAGTDPIPQYDNMQFQIKLYETTGVIEYIYGDWIPSGLGDDTHTVACGIKGSSSSEDQLLIVSKSVNENWNEVHFSNSSYRNVSPITYAMPPTSPAPDNGRTLRFTPTFNNDLGLKATYALGDASLYYSSPQTISAFVENAGRNTLQSIPVTLTVSGANTFTETHILTNLDQLQSQLLSFTDFRPDQNGPTTIEISLPDDDNISNNTLSWEQNVNDFSCQYRSSSSPIVPLGIAPGDAYILQARYSIHGTAAIKHIVVFIPDDPSNINQTVYSVVLDATGQIVDQSAPYLIDATALGTWHTFDMPLKPAFTDEDFFAGYAMTAASDFYFPLGIQHEEPLRPGTFYSSALDGAGQTELQQQIRLMIGAILEATPPVTGLAGSDPVICEGAQGTITIEAYTGFIRWQQSPDGENNWSNVTTGDGQNTSTYTTPDLSTTTYYRAEIWQPGYPSVYSNTVEIQVQPTPEAAGPINGPIEVCQNDQDVTYSIDPVANAEEYTWTLPDGAVVLSPTNSIAVSFGPDATSVNLSVYGYSQSCQGATSSLSITVHPLPATPVITAAGDALHSNALTGNQWYNQDGPIAGATDQDFLATSDGQYYVIVTLDGCASLASNVVDLVVTSSNQAEPLARVFIYPNPVTHQLFVEWPGNTGVSTFKIRNAIGIMVAEGSISDKAIIETGTMAPGIYYLEIGEKGNTVVKRFVKM